MRLLNGQNIKIDMYKKKYIASKWNADFVINTKKIIQNLFLKQEMQTRNQEEIKGHNKINYKQKNLEYIQKLKDKNKKEQQEKMLQQKKMQLRRQSLRKKILQDASKNRENKLRELKDIGNTDSGQINSHKELSPKKKTKASNIIIMNSASCISSPPGEVFTQMNTVNIDHLPSRIQSSANSSTNHNNITNDYMTQRDLTNSDPTQEMSNQTSNNYKTQTHQTMNNGNDQLNQVSIDKRQSAKKDTNKINYQNKYIEFLQNLHDANKKEKQMEEKKKKKQEQKMNKIKEELGFANVQGKLNAIIQKKSPQQIIRTKSAQKSHAGTQPLITSNNQQSQMPKTVKNFKQKNQQYIEKIKKKRALQEQKKKQDQAKKQKLKHNLKDFVINTVKKNVLEGVYDDQIEDKNQKKKKKQTKPKKQDPNQEENQPNQDQSSSEQDQEEEPEVKKKKKKLRSFPHCTDYTEWKKKNRLQQADKVFIITGGYPDLKKALKQRGWLHNTDSSSPFFDLKFTLQGRQIDYANLQDYQLVNHFQKNGVITTKIGLTKSLRNLMWISDTSEDNFYPKCFDLNDQDDKIGFQIHFKLCKALSILKIYVDSSTSRKKNDKENAGIIEDLKLRTEVALSVCRKNIEDVNQVIDKKKTHKIITDKEWQILSQDELNQQSLAKKKHEEWLKSIDCKFNGPTAVKQKQKKQKKPKKKTKKQNNKQNSQQQKKQNENNEQSQEEQQDELLTNVKDTLQAYQEKFPQYHLTGHNNIWILKPAGLSRGRGITTYNNLIEIQDHMKTKQSQWIAQKYIQNPLIIQRRKFDIRQWVVASSFNPLTIWFYDQCYIRFSAADYDAKEIGNKFIHLCNNSIGAYSKDFHKSHIKGNMYFMEQCREYLISLEGYDVFEEKIKPQMKDIVIKSLMCGVYGIENRKNSHQMFGYDFMVDTNYKVWLLEINSSPSMDYSTHITTKLVKEVLQDTAKLIIDYANAPKKEKKKVDTGKFKKIYKGVQVPQKLANPGLNLTLEGVALKKTKPINSVKITTYSLDKR